MSEVEPIQVTTTAVIEALQGLHLSIIQRLVLLHLIHAGKPATFTELLQITDSTPETLVTQMRQLYRAGYVRRLTARGANDPSYDFIATAANREDIKVQTKVDPK
jgi:hypothetical protein